MDLETTVLCQRISKLVQVSITQPSRDRDHELPMYTVARWHSGGLIA